MDAVKSPPCPKCLWEETSWCGHKSGKRWLICKKCKKQSDSGVPSNRAKKQPIGEVPMPPSLIHGRLAMQPAVAGEDAVVTKLRSVYEENTSKFLQDHNRLESMYLKMVDQAKAREAREKEAKRRDQRLREQNQPTGGAVEEKKERCESTKRLVGLLDRLLDGANVAAKA